MGLGKTAQAVALLHHLFHFENDRGPFLVVAPLSTLPHWKREFDSWTQLNTVLYHDGQGGKVTRDFIRRFEWYYYKNTSGVPEKVPGIWKMNVLVTSYEVMLSDIEELAEVPWSFLVIDEGQRIKNRAAKLGLALNALGIERRLMLSGTPLQNNTTELWTLLNFVEPDKFSSLDAFLASYGSLESADAVSTQRCEEGERVGVTTSAGRRWRS